MKGYDEITIENAGSTLVEELNFSPSRLEQNWVSGGWGYQSLYRPVSFLLCLIVVLKTLTLQSIRLCLWNCRTVQVGKDLSHLCHAH